MTISTCEFNSSGRAVLLAGLVAIGALGAGCGVNGTAATSGRSAPSSTSPAASSAPVRSEPTVVTTVPPATTVPPTTVPARPPTTTAVAPHFDTPQAAMVYLASAWNRGDATELMHVTTPAGRDQLKAMQRAAIDLRFNHCTARPGMGDYFCYFDHYYGDSVSKPSWPYVLDQFLVAPASAPGWYMTAFMACD